MTDLDTSTAILIAGISAFSAIVGGLIIAGSNYLIERQRSKREEAKALQDKADKEIGRRKHSYIDFLSISKDQVYTKGESGDKEFNPGKVEDRIAIIFTHGSPKISSIIHSAYPFDSWEAMEGVKKAVMKELILEKGEKNIVPLKASIVNRSGMGAELSKTK
jgi:hypothetical protein